MTEVFGRLTATGVIERYGSNRHLQVMCICGTVKFVQESSLRGGRTKSCGCLKSEVTAARNRADKLAHGHFVGGFPSKLYTIWTNMKGRCSNPNHPAYSDYGGRGITYDLRWANFEAFLKDMGEPAEGLTLDRKDNTLGYSKENCRWATVTEQANNRRSNVHIEYEGKRYRLQELADMHDVNYAAMKMRRLAGWTPKQLVRGYR